MKKIYLINEKELQRVLINKILVLTAIAGVAAYINVLIRTQNIGFSYRDAL